MFKGTDYFFKNEWKSQRKVKVHNGTVLLDQAF